MVKLGLAQYIKPNTKTSSYATDLDLQLIQASLESFQHDLKEIEVGCETIDSLRKISATIKKHGIDKTLISLFKEELEEVVDIETTPCDQAVDEIDTATEGVLSSVWEKIKAFFIKVVDFVKEMFAKVKGFFSKANEEVAEIKENKEKLKAIGLEAEDPTMVLAIPYDKFEDTLKFVKEVPKILGYMANKFRQCSDKGWDPGSTEKAKAFFVDACKSHNSKMYEVKSEEDDIVSYRFDECKSEYATVKSYGWTIDKMSSVLNELEAISKEETNIYRASTMLRDVIDIAERNANDKGHESSVPVHITLRQYHPQMQTADHKEDHYKVNLPWAFARLGGTLYYMFGVKLSNLVRDHANIRKMYLHNIRKTA